MFTIIHSCQNGFRGLAGRSLSVNQIASLMGRTTRGKPLKLRDPFPYRNKKIRVYQEWWDSTLLRLSEENAKLIVVDGPLAAGKTAFMKYLAQEFDMFAMREPTMDDVYIRENGYDVRQLDDLIPEDFRTFDHKNFCMDPCNEIGVSKFQINMTILRFCQYFDALAHIFNTGQGVIMERSVFSQAAFVDAMYAVGYLPKGVRDHYYFLMEIMEPFLLKPHLIIYLDVPVSTVQERIKARGLSYEVDSKALTPNYLSYLDNNWKNKYLSEAIKDSEVLVYDWSEGGDVDLVVEELEELDLDPLNRPEFSQLFDWRTYRLDLREKRLLYTNEKHKMTQILLYYGNLVPELHGSAEDFSKYMEVYERCGVVPKYDSVFDPKIRGLFKVLIGAGKRSPRDLVFIP